MSISVIIPVYNAENFIKSAVISVLDSKNVSEILLIEDGSSDGSLKKCLEIELSFDKVKLFYHVNNENKGPSASRNLGVLNATGDYIAFLDADDWYLKHRFHKDILLFQSSRKIDAVFSCTILEENLGINHLRYGAKNNPEITWGFNLSPLEYYRKVLETQSVLFHTNSITIKRDFLLEHKLFDERLYLHQDTELWFRLLRSGTFVASEWENPVAVIRRHSNNRISNRSSKSNLKMLAVLVDNIGVENLYDFETNYFYNRILRNESQKFKNHWYRRFYFYFHYSLNRFNKKRLIAQFKDRNA